jgi:hypothetical protein
MPYIKPIKRPHYDPHIESLLAHLRIDEWSAGCLNYIMSRLCWALFNENPSYDDAVSKVKGVLGDVADEFYRRKVVPYEEGKIMENGDLPEGKARIKEVK